MEAIFNNKNKIVLKFLKYTTPWVVYFIMEKNTYAVFIYKSMSNNNNND